MNNGDVIVNNAGIAPGVPPFLEMSEVEHPRAAVYLASDLSSYVNGASQTVDGGLSIAF